ncbi:MAG: L-serine ammonia-lyase [Bacteroidota bacterium]
MPALSVFDMLKVGVGPSSSHTLGPWRAVQRWLGELAEEMPLHTVERVHIDLYGSLALTGRGHCTDQALCLALLGLDPETVPVERIPSLISDLHTHQRISLGGAPAIPFDPVSDIAYNKAERLAGHANGMRCTAAAGDRTCASVYYSVGGGFVVKAGETEDSGAEVSLPYPGRRPLDVLGHCTRDGLKLAEMVRANEQAWRSLPEVEARLRQIWHVMRDGAYRGCHTEGTLPGGLGVQRRAARLNRTLFGLAVGEPRPYTHAEEWIAAIRSRTWSFQQVLKWVSAFALAINEENANLGRVVTAPTNGAAGVIPAVLLYHVCFAEEPVSEAALFDFLMVAGEVGTLFKKGATISAAMGGCQAEVGVSSAMAAAALAEARGATVPQALMAAEIAMEHHLGLTCDPIGGLVQVPCIERNTMGAVKAINAAELALEGDPTQAMVTLDEVIETMRQTAADMSDRYKETSQGGLAVNVSVRIAEC